MRTLLFLSLIQCTALLSTAQFADNFASISPFEMQLKKCEFDADAAVAVLLHEGDSDYEDGGRTIVTHYHMRRKVLKENGMGYGNFSVTYRSGDHIESIDNVEAMTINFDEQGMRHEYPVTKKSIYFKKINDKYSEMSFAFPEVKAGSILEYRYRSVMKNRGWIPDWYFQTELPVYVSKFALRPPPNVEFMYVVQKSDNYAVDITKAKPGEKLRFEMKNLPGLNREPYMDSREDYVQKISFQMTRYQGAVGAVNHLSSWNDVGKVLLGRAEFGGQLKADIPSEVAQFIKSLDGKSDMEKMKAIHHYVRSNFRWDENKGLLAEPGLKTLWSKRVGNSASINLATVNFLQEAKLEAYPVIVSERAHGRVDVNVPLVDQFNNTYAAVFIGGKAYYLDATDRLTPAYVTPSDILNTSALIVKKKNSQIAQVNEGDAGFKDIVYINSILSDQGEMNGEVQIISREYARSDYLSRYRLDEKNYAERYLKRNMANISIDSLIVQNTDVDSLPLAQIFKFRTNVQTSGDYTFLNLNMFTGFESSPFIQNNRFSNINFGSRRSLMFTSSIYLPVGLSVDALPKNMRVVNADKTISFTRQYIYSAESGQLVARIQVELNKSLYGSDEYPEIKEFFKKMTDLLNEQVVLKKKA